jgi:hypothetical protein
MGLLLIWCQIAFDSWLGHKDLLLIDANSDKHVMKDVLMNEYILYEIVTEVIRWVSDS